MGNQINSDFKNPAGKFSAFCFNWLEMLLLPIISITIMLAFFFRGATIKGNSMQNTLFSGDKVIVLKWNYRPKKGDVVIISRGQHLDESIVKRVIATQGDTLSINYTDYSIVVNGKKLDETYIKEPTWRQGDGEIPDVIPEGYLFVMGDNRKNSTGSESKIVGLIPYENIVGKVKFVISPFERFGVVR